MKKKFTILLLTVFLLPCLLLSTACANLFGNKPTLYYSDVPLDLVYSATLKRVLEVDRGTDPVTTERTTDLFAVAQKYETVAGEERFVTYVEWRQIGDWSRTQADNSYTFLHVEGKTFVLNEENVWKPESEIGSMFYDYNSRYANIVNSDSFRYMMTADIWLRTGGTHRHFYDKYKTKTTSEYIEYVFSGDETFRISNDKYNVLLYYSYDTQKGSRQVHEATFNVNDTSVPHLTPNGSVNGAHTSVVPYLDTITAEMLED